MGKVKWLYATFFALAFALIVEWCGSFQVQNNIDWFLGLNLPIFSLLPPSFTIAYSVMSVVEMYVVSSALVKGVVNPTLKLYASVKFSSLLFLTLFFTARSSFWGLVTMTVTLTLFWIFAISLFKSPVGKPAKVLLPALLLWYSYLWSFSYAVALIN